MAVDAWAGYGGCDGGYGGEYGSRYGGESSGVVNSIRRKNSISFLRKSRPHHGEELSMES